MEGSNIKYNSNSNIKNNLKFILPSLLGIILFMIPIKYNDQITIPEAIFSNALVNFRFIINLHNNFYFSNFCCN